MDFYKLLDVFVNIDIWISLSCYLDLSKWLHGFVKVVMWICPSCSTYFLTFVKQDQAEVWPRFQSLLKLLLWTKGIEWVKVFNALGPLCLKQCLYFSWWKTQWQTQEFLYATISQPGWQPLGEDENAHILWLFTSAKTSNNLKFVKTFLFPTSAPWHQHQNKHQHDSL